MILLSDCVAQVESAGNPLSMRFEPTFSPTLSSQQACQKYATAGYMDMTTARMICQTSWGKFQIMGANLYSNLNFKDTLLSYLSDAGIQLVTFQDFIAQIGFTDGPFQMMSQQALLKFATLYNGSEVYAESLHSVYKNMEQKA